MRALDAPGDSRCTTVRVVVAVVAVAMLFQAERVSASSTPSHRRGDDQLRDATAQFIELRVGGLQTFVSHTVLAAFDTSGAYIGDILRCRTTDQRRNGVRWLVATASDRERDARLHHARRACRAAAAWSASAAAAAWWRRIRPIGTARPRTMSTAWPMARTRDPATPEPAPRRSSTATATVAAPAPSDNAADFACGDPATPQNNAGDMIVASYQPVSGGEPTATPTPPVGERHRPRRRVAVGRRLRRQRQRRSTSRSRRQHCAGNAPLSECPRRLRADRAGRDQLPRHGVNNGLNGCSS